ncbi:MAG: metallophosphatase domain-containing protein [Myxococcota bacterium]
MADTHGFHEKLTVPDGDVLIHAGDLTMRGTRPQLEAVADWLRRLPHRHKVVVAGNHDFLFENEPAAARAIFRDFLYLEDAEVTVAGLRIWGSPWQPWFHSWAFNLHRGAPLEEKWKLIPEGLDILVTHGPPAGYGDRCFDGREVGCEDLLRHLGRAKPRYHLFGHIHEARGQWEVAGMTLVNVTTNECELPVTVMDVPSRAAG